jgi:hypothetical protein
MHSLVCIRSLTGAKAPGSFEQKPLFLLVIFSYGVYKILYLLIYSSKRLEKIYLV